MQDRLNDVINKFKNLCDYMEIRVEDFEGTKITVKTGDTQVRRSSELGGNVRVLIKGAWGFSSFNSLSLLNEFAEKAISQAKRTGKGKSFLAPVPPVIASVKAEMVSDHRSLPLREKVKIFECYNNLILNYDRKKIKNSDIFYMDQFIRKFLATSDGTYIEQELPLLGTSIVPLASRDGITSKPHVSAGSTNDFSICRNLENQIEETCKLSINFLDAPKVKSGKYTVICDSFLNGTLVHEAFGHNCEADKYKNKKIRKEMEPGKELGSKILNIYDTGLITGNPGSFTYDDEGVKTEKTYLIKEGILTGMLHTRETAALFNEKPTGSARASAYDMPPLCRMRTTCMEKGKSSFSEMIKDIKTGIYAVKNHGGTGGETFTAVPACSYMIRDGEIAEPVRDVKITGNIYETLKNIDMIGAELKQDWGFCGKGGQFLPVGKLTPSIRVHNVTVGGQG